MLLRWPSLTSEHWSHVPRVTCKICHVSSASLSPYHERITHRTLELFLTGILFLLHDVTVLHSHIMCQICSCAGQAAGVSERGGGGKGGERGVGGSTIGNHAPYSCLHFSRQQERVRGGGGGKRGVGGSTVGVHAPLLLLALNREDRSQQSASLSQLLASCPVPKQSSPSHEL